ncbi:MAG: two-component regulator propeller domain-containing protein [Bacteroidota bacterium]
MVYRIYHMLFIFVLALASHAGKAQNYQLRGYGLEEGLPQSQVSGIVQDTQGYLWLGTHGGGLCNFDGQQFRLWKAGDGIPSNYIHALQVIGDTLFVGTRKGLSLKTGKHFNTFDCPTPNQIFPFGNTCYLATQTGVFQWKKDTGLERLQIHPELDASIVNAIFFDSSFFWIATNQGLWKLDALNGKATVQERIQKNNFKDVLAHKKQLFAATYDDGIWVWDLEKQNGPLLIREPLRINSLSIQNDKELWVATENDGIRILDTDTFVEKQGFPNRSLQVPNVRAVFKDNRSHIWIGTWGGGFYSCFQNNFEHYNQGNGLRGNRIYAVHSDAQGLWASNSEAGLVRIDSLGVHPVPNPEDFPRVRIKTIASDSKGHLWAGTDGGGLLFHGTVSKDSVMIRVTDSLTVERDTVQLLRNRIRMLGREKGFPSNWISDIVVGKDNWIYASTYAKGILKFRYYPEEDSLVIPKRFGEKKGLGHSKILDLTRQKSQHGDKIWYATQNGDLGYLKDDRVTHFPKVLQEEIPIGNLLFHNDILLLGTEGKGVWWSFLEEPLQFQKLTGAKRPASGNIQQLVFDGQGYLWVGTERGVDKIVLDAEHRIQEVFHFGRNDGFIGGETCLNAVDKDIYGNLWFGTLNGLNRYTPGNTLSESRRPDIRFTALEVANSVVDSIDPQDWANTEKVFPLTPEQRQIGFSYKSVDLYHPKEIQYRFKLNDSDWSPWSTNGSQRLAGLAYGAHVFTAQSRNNRWEESLPVRFQFHIALPFYKQWQFQWGLFGGILLLLAFFVLSYIRRIRKRNRTEREHLELKNHLLTLEQKALQLQMNPHFVFNVLNGIKAMAPSKPEKMNETVNSFAQLLRETLYNSRKAHITLEQELKTLRHYIQVEQLMAPNPFVFSIQAETNPDPEEILIPPMLVQPFVENAIRHGIHKGKRAGELLIDFHTKNDFLYCTVTDNGEGIFESQKKRPKTDHQSMAIKVNRERLESLSGKDALKIREIHNESGTVVGTQIVLKIPLLTEF